MSGWLVAVPLEADLGVMRLEELFAAWHSDPDQAVKLVQRLQPVGSQVTPRPVAELSDSMLRGVRLSPGEAALLHVH